MSNQTILTSEVEISIDADEKGFCLNCDVPAGDFEQDMIPGILLTYARRLCKEMGLSFDKVLRNSIATETRTKLDTSCLN